MSDWTDAWGNTGTPDKKEYDDIPKGKYSATLTGAKLNETNTDKEGVEKPRVEFEWTIRHAKFNGRKVWSNYNLYANKDGEFNGIEFLKQDLQNMGLTISDLKPEQLADALGSVLHTRAIIYIKPREFQGKTYYNAYVNEVEESDNVDDGIAPTADTSEQLPF